MKENFLMVFGIYNLTSGPFILRHLSTLKIESFTKILFNAIRQYICVPDKLTLQKVKK